MGGFNGIKTLTEGLPGQNRTQQNAERYAEVAALEELAKSRGNTTYNSPWPIPSEYVAQQRTAQPFQQNAPMTLEELEKRLISESSHAMASNAAAAQLSQREMPFQMPPPSLDPHQRPPGLPPFIPPHILQMHMARMIAAGAIPRPPMPPFPGAFMPPFGMPPMHMQNRKMPFMRRDNHMGSPVLPPHLSEMVFMHYSLQSMGFAGRPNGCIFPNASSTGCRAGFNKWINDKSVFTTIPQEYAVMSHNFRLCL
jgi:hypothetical protein